MLLYQSLGLSRPQPSCSSVPVECTQPFAVVVQVAETDNSPETCFWAKQDLQRVIAEERQWRCKLWSTGWLPLLAFAVHIRQHLAAVQVCCSFMTL